MELNNYRSVTPLKKKRKKITASAALILCMICLLLGVLCGRAISSGKQAQEAEQKIAQFEQEMEIERTRFQAEIDAYKTKINDLNVELTETKQIIANNQAAVEEEVAAPSEEPDPSLATEESDAPVEEPKASGGFGRIALIGILILVIMVCIIFAATMFLKKDDDDDDDDEYDDEDYEDYDDDEEYYEEDEEELIEEDETEE